ncbi:MAG: acyl-CoA desaturase [Myxococcales bacterium]|nr:acyl-CoA desaturase [Myxococcales bacterium]
MEAIIVFFLAHWWGSVFMQTFFLHRYASHGMFSMSKFWERVFHFFTFLFQGSSYLVPRAYAWMHREHHAYSDTEKDPHSPHFYSNVWSMMRRTADYYADYVVGTTQTEERFRNRVPVWGLIDTVGNSWATRLAFGAAYVAFYVAFAPSWGYYLLLPIHFLMGPIHGAIVNWCGHKYGYRNFNTRDRSVNAVACIEFVTLGELFQNNHHRYGQAPNFAKRWFEFDPTYPVLRLLDALKVIDLSTKPIHLPDNPPAELAAATAVADAAE